jgi:hypothetical protein
MVELLSKEDWIEIYYAVRDKHETVLLGRNLRSGQSVCVWKAHLSSIMEKIGPDGENMYEEEQQCNARRNRG